MFAIQGHSPPIPVPCSCGCRAPVFRCSRLSAAGRSTMRHQLFGSLSLGAFPRLALAAFLLAAIFASGCTRTEKRTILATAYCGCGECNGYTRGHWYFLWLDFWNRVYTYGTHKGEPY